jgi:uncharacterized protein
MLIAVIADTHDELPASLPGLVSGAEEIWHLGDVITPDILFEINELNKPLRLVAGNCDFESSWPLSLSLEREGVRCHLVHIPPARVPKGTQLLLHGHTHVPRDYTDHMGCRWLNPGSVSRPRGGSKAGFAWLELKAGRVERWERVCL